MGDLQAVEVEVAVIDGGLLLHRHAATVMAAVADQTWMVVTFSTFPSCSMVTPKGRTRRSTRTAATACEDAEPLLRL